MKTNRSLKEILLPKSRFAEDSKTNQNISLYSINSPSNTNNINLESIAKHLPIDSGNKLIKNQKSCQSQKQLDIPILKIQITSPKYYPTDCKTDRVGNNQQKHKEMENVEISPFILNKNLRLPNYKTNALTPVNRNIQNVQQPKRPKILSKQRPSLTFFEEFKIGKTLGKGRFGNVYRGQHYSTGMVVAVKQISLQRVCRKLIERLTWEIKIQSFLKHQHCLQLYKCYKQGNNLYLVVELGDCSLFDKLRQKRYFTEVQTCYYITQTMKALIYMHQQGVIHRDLKPENIVLINNIVKLADFGWSIFNGKNSKRTTFCGTLDYVSPQIVMGNQYDEMVDVWSVGVLCYQLCTGHAPFQSSKSRQQTYRKILNVQLKFPKYLSEDVKDFITRLLTKRPENRMSLEQAMNHRWVKKYFMK